MAVRIRLSRIGKKHVPFYRIVAVDSRQKRDGAFLDNLGTYDATKSTLVTFNEERYNHWVSQGALPTDSAKKIFKQYKRSVAAPTTKKAAATAPKKKAAAPKKDKAEAKPAESKKQEDKA